MHVARYRRDAAAGCKIHVDVGSQPSSQIIYPRIATWWLHDICADDGIDVQDTSDCT